MEFGVCFSGGSRKLSEAWANFSESDRADLGNGALQRITKVSEDLKYNPNEEFAIFAKDAGELGMQSVLSHLPSNPENAGPRLLPNFLEVDGPATLDHRGLSSGKA